MKTKVVISQITIMTLGVLFGLLIACQGNKKDTPQATETPVSQVTTFSHPGVQIIEPATSTQPGVYAKTNCTPADSSGQQLLAAPSEATYKNLSTTAGSTTGSSTFLFCIQLQGEQEAISQIQSNNKSPALNYLGSVTMTGSMTISSGTKVGSCQLPAGDYTLNSTQPGLFNPISFSIPEFEAVSATHRITFRLRRGLVKDLNADGKVDRLGLDISVLGIQANGQEIWPCTDLVGLIFN